MNEIDKMNQEFKKCVGGFLCTGTPFNMADPPDFQEILKAKRDYYGNTEGAIECAAEAFARIYHETELRNIRNIEKAKRLLYHEINTK